MSEEPKISAKYVMVESGPFTNEDEIDLLELIRTLLGAWKTIASISVFCTCLAIAYALSVPESFKAETLLASAQEDQSGVPSSLSQFGGLAAMAGISIPSSSNIERVLATLETREFLKQFISKRNLLPIIFDEKWDKSSATWKKIEGQEEITIEDGIVPLQGAIEVDQDKSGLVILSVSWKDPDIAAQWANELVKQLNEQLRQKAIADSKKRMGYLEQELAKTTLLDMRKLLFNLLESEKQKAMLANVNDEFALEVIDPAVAPKVRAKPNRRLIVILVGLSGVLFGVCLVFLLQFVRKMTSFNQKTISSNV